jgi:Fe-S oxidoreductase
VANPAFKGALHRLLGMERKRTFPPFARPTFIEWFKARGGSPQRDKKVVLFNDTYMTYNYPQIGMAAVKVLEAAGVQVILPAKKKCCGRPMISKGMLSAARANAIHNIGSLLGYVEQGYPIVGCEPSCIATFRDEYPDLIDDKRAEAVGKNVFMIDEFLAMLHRKGELNLKFTDLKKNILYHGHCYQKALIGTAPSLISLRLPPGYKVEEIDSGCCGMAGAFGYEVEHYDISLKIGGVRLFPAVKSCKDGAEVAVAGVSCRQQVEHGTGVKARHLIEVLADAL